VEFSDLVICGGWIRIKLFIIFGYGFYKQKLKRHLSSLKTPNQRIYTYFSWSFRKSYNPLGSRRSFQSYTGPPTISNMKLLIFLFESYLTLLDPDSGSTEPVKSGSSNDFYPDLREILILIVPCTATRLMSHDPRGPEQVKHQQQQRVRPKKRRRQAERRRSLKVRREKRHRQGNQPPGEGHRRRSDGSDLV
jgi:hypothetical protein